MLFEFIATIAAAFGMAGLALIITHLSKLAGKRAPKWLIPLFAAIGIFAFQIHQEYNWYPQQVAKLPEGVTVVKTAESTEWFRPWSYAKPQILRFIAADVDNASVQVDNSDIYLVNLYLFERRRSVQKVPQVIDCNAPARADYVLPEKGSTLTIDEHVKQTTAWRDLAKDELLFTSICSDKV
ncbi:hypothetical protein [uncultured Psychrobacter sp.]|uniref:hypothetical protein n=1 Tax=uncultured Psychrobacter sp. TaxID=259303 RepID=UPI00261BD3DF|nr:hypothetical protein [uncultured Psychrobacter sp.]